VIPEIANGSFKRSEPRAIRGSGYVSSEPVGAISDLASGATFGFFGAIFP
jgi:hypothetical protein